MIWYYNLSNLEFILIGAFLLLYLLYVLRMVVIAIKIKTSVRRIFYKFVLRSIYFVLIIVALQGPSFGDFKKEIRAVGKDIYMLVDLSESMRANDVLPSRLTRAKIEMGNMVKQFPSDRIGIIIFSSDAFLHCPLTTDEDALNLFIESLNPELIDNKGTSYHQPFELALEKFKDVPKGAKNNNSRVALLISDGENFGENIWEGIEDLKDEHIRVYCLGIGTEKGSNIPTDNGDLKRDISGNPVITYLKPDLLERIAQTTGGKNFFITEELNETDFLINTINEVEGFVREVKKIDASANKYFYFLLVGLFLMIFDVLLTVRIIRI